MRILAQTGFGYTLTDMHRLLVVVAILMLTYNSTCESDNEAKVIQYEYDNDGKGNYNFSFSTSNFISREESGTVVNEGLPNQYILVKGRVVYYKPDGDTEAWEYTADNTGYHRERLPSISELDVVRIEVPPSVVATLLGK